MSEALESLFNDLDRFAMETVPGVDQVPPTFFLVEADGSGTVIVAPWNSNREKALALDHLRATMAERGTAMYGAIIEVWTAKVGPDASVNSIEPRLREDRQEAITILVADRSGASLCGLREIIRTDIAISLGELSRPDAGEGALLSLLKAA